MKSLFTILISFVFCTALIGQAFQKDGTLIEKTKVLRLKNRTYKKVMAIEDSCYSFYFDELYLTKIKLKNDFERVNFPDCYETIENKLDSFYAKGKIRRVRYAQDTIFANDKEARIVCDCVLNKLLYSKRVVIYDNRTRQRVKKVIAKEYWNQEWLKLKKKALLSYPKMTLFYTTNGGFMIELNPRVYRSLKFR